MTHAIFHDTLKTMHTVAATDSPYSSRRLSPRVAAKLPRSPENGSPRGHVIFRSIYISDPDAHANWTGPYADFLDSKRSSPDRELVVVALISTRNLYPNTHVRVEALAASCKAHTLEASSLQRPKTNVMWRVMYWVLQDQ